MYEYFQLREIGELCAHVYSRVFFSIQSKKVDVRV